MEAVDHTKFSNLITEAKLDEYLQRTDYALIDKLFRDGGVIYQMIEQFPNSSYLPEVVDLGVYADASSGSVALSRPVDEQGDLLTIPLGAASGSVALTRPVDEQGDLLTIPLGAASGSVVGPPHAARDGIPNALILIRLFRVLRIAA